MDKSRLRNRISLLLLLIFTLSKISGLHIYVHSQNNDPKVEVEHCFLCDWATLSTQHFDLAITAISVFLVLFTSGYTVRPVFFYTSLIPQRLYTYRNFSRPPPAL